MTSLQAGGPNATATSSLSTRRSLAFGCSSPEPSERHPAAPLNVIRSDHDLHTSFQSDDGLEGRGHPCGEILKGILGSRRPFPRVHVDPATVGRKPSGAQTGTKSTSSSCISRAAMLVIAPRMASSISVSGSSVRKLKTVTGGMLLSSSIGSEVESGASSTSLAGQCSPYRCTP